MGLGVQPEILQFCSYPDHTLSCKNPDYPKRNTTSNTKYVLERTDRRPKAIYPAAHCQNLIPKDLRLQFYRQKIFHHSALQTRRPHYTDGPRKSLCQYSVSRSSWQGEQGLLSGHHSFPYCHHSNYNKQLLGFRTGQALLSIKPSLPYSSCG